MSVQLMWLLTIRYQPSLRSRLSSSICHSMRVVRRMTKALQPSQKRMMPLLIRLQARLRAGIGSSLSKETSRIKLETRMMNNMVGLALISITSGPGRKVSMGVVYCVSSASSWLRVWSFSCQIPFNHC
ncbi:hypothetical protein D3C79_966160 [compost metagenome]